MNLPDIQRGLDRHVLQIMEESRDRSYGRWEYAFGLSWFVDEPWITKDMARAACRSLTDRGYAFYMRGLWNEDGYPAGAGYGITDKGAEYLETLFAAEERGARKAVKVKPLVWEWPCEYGLICRAETSIGTYSIHQDEDSAASALLMYFHLNEDGDCTRYAYQWRAYFEPEEFQAAAQAHYEARIMSALDLDPAKIVDEK